MGRQVSIFSTDTASAGYPPFAHGETTYRFHALGSTAPAGLIDGTVWLFVDWLLPDLSGLELCRRLRADPRLQTAHVTMLLEEDSLEDRRRALAAGADDYAVGPLGRQAMLDRVLALQTGPAAIPQQQLSLGDLQINVAGQQATWQGRLIPLRPNEFRVLRFMVEHPNRVLAREELVTALGKAGDPDYLRTVDVWIKRLRFGLKVAGAQSLLRTVHGRGYVLDLI
ncbi:response regulator transcription factor [Croceibacterium mercuriale]|uniref:response regulator transcription factor n=1 Tax=Croceibacterium mercuriale TaxID=1572751 RepID=UPI00068FC8A3|nr:response regulator transcription factor [Croceibacterium mercuriale]